jgi:hypothetical protein
MADGASTEVLDAFSVGRDDGQLVEKVEIGGPIRSANGRPVGHGLLEPPRIE